METQTIAQNLIINSVDDIIKFFNELLNNGINFHPDTDFNDYINLETLLPIFTKHESTRLNELMDSCFVYCEKNNLDIYEIALENFNSPN